MYNSKNYTSDICFIGVDWGLTNLRAYVVDSNGEVKQRTKSSSGILRVGRDSFASILKRSLGKWFNKYPGVPIIMFGAIGDRAGWQETSLLNTPVATSDFSEFAEKIINHSFEREIWVLPGIKRQSQVLAANVIRGGEIQAFGINKLHQLNNAWVCIPGLASKWVKFSSGEAIDIKTFFTGELHSSLMKGNFFTRPQLTNIVDQEFFSLGLKLAEKEPELMNGIVLIQGASACEDLPPDLSSAYLLGMLIGHEVQTCASMLEDNATIHTSGTAWLCELYEIAAHHFKLEATFTKPEDATIAALFDIAQKISLR